MVAAVGEPAIGPRDRRHRLGRWVLGAALVASSTLSAGRAARAPDSNASPRAPAHWLPNEQWVKEHWLPYEEGRLYRLLHITRAQVWQQLRDDARNVAQLARVRGWSARPLAAALVAPRASSVSAAKLATLRERALRTLTQGHLSQHIFFHSLHEFAVPGNAPAILGVHSEAEYQALRRADP